MKESFFDKIMRIFGFNQDRGGVFIPTNYSKPNQKAPKDGSLNKQMRACREPGAGSRREARNLVKAVNKQDKRDARAIDRKRDPERYKLFGFGSRYRDNQGRRIA